jgi:sortase A
MITFGVVVLLFVVYELWGTGLETARAQNRAQERIADAWRGGGPDPVPVDKQTGEPSTKPVKITPGADLAIIRVPRFGKGYTWVIGEGTGREQLKKGPGHYAGTELPGEVGNFVISAHRTTYQAPFNKVDLLKPGDAVVIETRNQWFTYRVTDADIVRPDQVEVTLPVPYQPDAKPSKRLITLTTCHPKFSARERYIVFGELESVLDKTAGSRPPALGEA